MNLFNQLSRSKSNQNDLFWEFDGSKHFRPKIEKGEFFKLTEYDFAWLLLQPLFNFINTKDQELEKSKSFSYTQKALYFWWHLDSQIANGGFVQFYFKGYGIYMPTILKGLDCVGDKEMGSLLKQVDNIFLNKKALIADLKQQNLTHTEVYERLDELALFDEKYFHLKQRTLSLLENYIRKHPNEVCLDEEGNEFNPNYTGLYCTYCNNHKIKEQFNLKDDLIHGEFKSFYQSGQLQEKLVYSKGKPTGEREEFYKNGKLKYEVVKDLDKKTNTHRSYYENGNLAEVSTYNSNHIQIGDWLEFYDNGSKKLEAHYVNGECLLKNHWNIEGEHILKDGTGVFISEGKVKKLEQEFKDYKKHGMQKTYVNGILSLYQEMSNDKSNGVTRSYYENGNLEKETLYNNGSIISSKEFPKFENPKVETTIVSRLCEENYIWPDNMPNPLNVEALENNINAEVSILKAYHDDYILIYSYVLNVNIQGIVTHIEMSVSANMRMVEDIEANLKQLKFEVALKDEKPVESIYVVECQFKLVD